MTYAFIVAALLTVTDPTGDTIGNGTLTPPTAAPFRSLSVFDVQQIMVPDEDTLGVVLTMGRVNEPWQAAGGFPLPIIEIYLSSDEGGRDELLPGSSMQLPPERRWNYAFQIAGDQFRMLRGSSDNVTDITEVYNASLSRDDNRFLISSDLEMPDDFTLYGMVGSYDPFSRTGWRPVLEEPSPWAFSSDSQIVPVIDVIAEDFAQQQQAIDSRTLPEIRPPSRQNYWLWVMASGLVFIAAGLVGRFTVRTETTANESLEAPSDASAQETDEETTEAATNTTTSEPSPAPAGNRDDLDGVAVPNYQRLNVPYKLPSMQPRKGAAKTPASAAQTAEETLAAKKPEQANSKGLIDTETVPPDTAPDVSEETIGEASTGPDDGAQQVQASALRDWLDFDFDDDEQLELDEDDDTWSRQPARADDAESANNEDSDAEDTETVKEGAGSSRR